MKLTINGCEVEIKVKGEFSNLATKQDTMYFLNELSIWAREAAAYSEEHYGYSVFRREAAKQIHDCLKANGLYDNIE